MPLDLLPDLEFAEVAHGWVDTAMAYNWFCAWMDYRPYKGSGSGPAALLCPGCEGMCCEVHDCTAHDGELICDECCRGIQ